MLFLCTGNSARSQMAEAYLRHSAGDTFEVHSAGLEPKGVNPYSQQVMEEIGISLKGQHSKAVRKYLDHVNFGCLITVCDHVKKNCPTIFLGVSHRLHWSFEDPAASVGTDEDTLKVFRRVRDQIQATITNWLTEQNVQVLNQSVL